MKMKCFLILALIVCFTLPGCDNIFDGNDDSDSEKKEEGNGEAAAPNIYLYPENAMDISVELTFTDNNGFFTHTEPEYGDGWDVWVEPDGLVDGTYDFLYYAGELRSQFQTVEGWAVGAENVFDWFEDTMLAMGFNQKETGDFIDYWTGHLPASPCYHIYPQSTKLVNEHVAINIDPLPDTLVRIWFYIERVENCEALLAPQAANPFERDGFVVVEWGVFMPFE